LPDIFVDADACPVKQEVYSVARRYRLKVILVANSSMNVPQEDGISLVMVKGQMDAADDWIVDHAASNDIVITGDIPLAARCLKIRARVLEPKGQVFTEASISSALAHRDIMQYLRNTGMETSGPPPFTRRDHSRFLQSLDKVIREILGK
jgi:uncharacterized protein